MGCIGHLLNSFGFQKPDNTSSVERLELYLLDRVIAVSVGYTAFRLTEDITVQIERGDGGRSSQADLSVHLKARTLFSEPRPHGNYTSCIRHERWNSAVNTTRQFTEYHQHNIITHS